MKSNGNKVNLMFTSSDLYDQEFTSAISFILKIINECSKEGEGGQHVQREMT